MAKELSSNVKNDKGLLSVIDKQKGHSLSVDLNTREKATRYRVNSKGYSPSDCNDCGDCDCSSPDDCGGYCIDPDS